MIKTHDLRIRGFEPLPTPAELRARLPLGTETEGLVTSSRREVEAVLNGDDDRLLVVVGPCSVHDPGGRAGVRPPAGRRGRAACRPSC